MWTVIGGQGRSTFGRWCQDRQEAEGWARQLIRAGITPVKINGVLFEPGSEGSAELAP
jgi:hypothetical protein